MKKSKKRCWACGYSDVIFWGKREGKQRFKCKRCGILLTGNRPEQRTQNRFVWFHKWILERQTFNGFIVKAMGKKSKLNTQFNVPANHQVYASLLIGYPKMKNQNETSRKSPKLDFQ